MCDNRTGCRNRELDLCRLPIHAPRLRSLPHLPAGITVKSFIISSFKNHEKNILSRGSGVPAGGDSGWLLQQTEGTQVTLAQWRASVLPREDSWNLWGAEL